MNSFTTNHIPRPAISVVLPVYNHATFLREAIDSVLSQEGLLELIVVNDGSTDPAVISILKSYDHPRLKVIDQKNGGISAALNRGFEEARGRFLTWISADNRFKPGALRCMQEFLQNHRKVSLVYANVSLIDQNGAPYQGNTYRPINLRNNTLRLPHQSDTLWEFADNFINACFLYRHDDANFVGRYNEKFRGFEDYDYWLRLSFAGKISHLDSDTPLYDYRIHEESLTHTLSWDKMREECRQLIANIKRQKSLLQQPLRTELTNATELPAVFSALQASRVWCSKTSVGTAGSILTLSTENKHLGNAELSSVTVDASSFYHQGFASTFVQEQFAITTLQRTVDEQTRQLHIPTIETQPRILLRARDDNFLACAPHEGSKRTLLIFCPDFREEKSFLGLKKTTSQRLVSLLSETIKQLRDFTFVLYCQTKAERTTADKINLELSNNQNLRIIDVCDQQGDCLQESLLYAVSSVDEIFAILPNQTAETSCLIELRLLSVVAALSRLPLIVAFADQEHFAKEIGSSSDIVSQFLYRELLDTPHCFCAALAGNDIAQTILGASLQNTPHQLDEWLETTTLDFLGKRVVSFLTCP